jgi:hypothetical protein
VIVDLAKSVRVEDEVTRRGGLGLKRQGHELVGACPQCGGDDRFSVSIKKQVFHCRGCNRAGDIIDLVRHIDGVSFKTAVQLLGVGCDGKPVTRSKAKPDGQNLKTLKYDHRKDGTANVERALAIWNEGSPIAGTIAETYLRRRGLEPPDDDEALRYFSPCPFSDGTHPALVALFRDIHTDEPRAIHRIALGPGGILIGKKMLGQVAGAAVKLDADIDVELGLVVGEGIETCLAARQLGFSPTWALGSSGAIRSFPALGGINSLTIVVDNDVADKNGRQAGQEAATECRKRWCEAGREVNLVIPKSPGADVADYFGARNDQ